MYKFSFYVPVEYADKVKKSLFDLGVGKIGNYDCCSFETLGTGQFRPLKGSQAFVGNVGQIEKIQELKVEMVCSDDLVKKAVALLKEVHPYETPAYDVWKLSDL